jgi:hypothetical protein
MQPVVTYKRTRGGRRKKVASTSWTAECEQIRFRKSQIGVFSTTWVFTGGGVLKTVKDTRTQREWAGS